MTLQIRPAAHEDLPRVLELNNGAIPHVNRLDAEQLTKLADWSEYFRVVHNDAGIVGFLLALLPGQPYASTHYRWFDARYADFVYIDRIVIGPNAKGTGAGRLLYADLIEYVRGLSEVAALTCEVNIVPPNEPSQRFHARLGFVELDRLDREDGAKTVSLLRLELD